MAEIEDTPVAAPETPAAPPPPPPAPSRRRAGWPGLVLGGVIAAGLGFGVAQVVPGGWPLGDVTALQARVDKLTADLAALQSQVAALPTAAPATDPALADRLAALEAKAAPLDLSTDLAALKDQLAQLAAQVAASGSGSATAVPGIDPSALKALQDQVAALVAAPSAVQVDLDAALKAAEDKIQAASDAATKRLGDLATMASLRQLEAAVESGAPFQAALDALGLTDLPAVLSEHAAGGLPRLQDLKDAFPDTARAALDAARRADMGASWTDRISNFLQAQTGARSLEPREGNDPDAVLSRAAEAVAKGDLAGALTEIAALPEAAQPALADWIASAQLRLQAMDALKALGAGN